VAGNSELSCGACHHALGHRGQLAARNRLRWAASGDRLGKQFERPRCSDCGEADDSATAQEIGTVKLLSSSNEIVSLNPDAGAVHRRFCASTASAQQLRNGLRRCNTIRSFSMRMLPADFR